jgi:hypothetical protein
MFIIQNNTQRLYGKRGGGGGGGGGPKQICGVSVAVWLCGLSATETISLPAL